MLYIWANHWLVIHGQNGRFHPGLLFILFISSYFFFVCWVFSEKKFRYSYICACVCVCVCSSRYIENAQLMVSACSVLFQQHHGSRQCLFNRRTTLFSVLFFFFLHIQKRKDNRPFSLRKRWSDSAGKMRPNDYHSTATTTIILLLPIPLYWVRLTAWFWIFHLFKKTRRGVYIAKRECIRRKKYPYARVPAPHWPLMGLFFLNFLWWGKILKKVKTFFFFFLFSFVCTCVCES